MAVIISLEAEAAAPKTKTLLAVWPWWLRSGTPTLSLARLTLDPTSTHGTPENPREGFAFKK